MADHITLSITGLREMGLNIEKWGAELEADCRKELEQEVEFTVGRIQADAPVGEEVRGGDHHEAGLLKKVRSKVEAVGVSARIWLKARHAHLVEWGHQGAEYKKPHTVMLPSGEFRVVKKSGPARPHPFFVPNVIKARKRFYDRIERVLAKVREL